MNNLVKIQDGRAVADSRDVATMFEKDHRNVLRSIDSLIADAPELLRNFEQQFVDTPAGNGAVRKYRTFCIDRDGFSLLAMGFTGAKALQWKIAYIQAFNAMEARSTEPVVPAFGDHEAWRVSLQFVREARTIGGRAAGRRAWDVAGLPDVFTENTSLQIGRYVVADDVAEWFAERVERAAGTRTPSSWLYSDYQGWAAQQERDGVSMVIFGKSLTALGVRGFNSNGIKREGVRLRSR